MADERQKLFPDRAALIPRALDWQSLERLDGDDLDTHYRHILVELGKKPGMLGTIFRKAQNRIQDPAKLKRLISDLIGREQWTTLGVDVKGDAYEGLLEKNAADVKDGAGQYFTPRALIQAIVDVMRPEAGQLIHDHACGTGGFLLAVHDYISNHFTLDKDEKRFLKEKALTGVEIVDGPAQPGTSSEKGGSANRGSQKTVEQWTDPALLHLLDGTSINCLVVDWAEGGEADAAQQKALQPLIQAGRRRGISFVGRVTTKNDLSAIASAGRAAGLEALLLPGPVSEQLALPTIVLFSRENVDWDHVSGIFALNGNVWPGAVLHTFRLQAPSNPPPASAEPAEPAGPTTDPWVDSNGWVSLLARSMVPGKTLWLEFEPKDSAKMLPAEQYCLAVADARASGCR